MNDISMNTDTKPKTKGDPETRGGYVLAVRCDRGHSGNTRFALDGAWAQCAGCGHFVARAVLAERQRILRQGEGDPMNETTDHTIDCPGCDKPFAPEDLIRYYDRHMIYSGRACSDQCARVLPGQGDMWDYDAEELIEPPE